MDKEPAVIKPSSLDLKTQYTAKIVVSSTEKSPLLSPKRPHPRQVVKRSLSFSYNPAKDATKAFQRISRSASLSERLGLRKDSSPKPTIQSEVSCDSSMRRSSFVADNSHMTEHDSCKSLNSVVFSPLCSHLMVEDEKSEDGRTCNKSENDCGKTTTDLEKSVKAPPGTLASLTPELKKVYLTHLATLKKCSNVSKKAKCSHSDSELKPSKVRKPLMEQTDFNALSNVMSSLSSSNREPREAYMTIGEFPGTSSLIDYAIRKSPCRQDGPSRSTIVKEDDAPSPLESARVTLRESTGRPSTGQRSYQHSSRTVHSCVRDASPSSSRGRREYDVSQPSTSLAQESLQCSLVEKREYARAQSTVVSDASTSSSPNRREYDVSQASTSPVQTSLKSSLLVTVESPGAQSTVEESFPGLYSVSPLSFWSDSSVVFFSHSNRIPFLNSTPENSPVKEVVPHGENPMPASSDYRHSHDELFAGTRDNQATVDKTTSFSEASKKKVKTSNSASSPFDESKLYFSYLEKDIFNRPIISKEVLPFCENQKLHDNLQNVGMEISESSNVDKTNLNKEDDLHSLKNTASPTNTFQFHPNWDLHDNLQTIDMEISESSNMDKSDLTKEDTSDAFENTTSPTKTRQLHTNGDLHDNLQIIDMEISESLPSPIVLSQAYPYASPAPNYDYPGSHCDNVMKTLGGVTSYAGENRVRASLNKHKRDEEILASSFVQQPSVTTTSESPPLALSISQSTGNITTDRSTTKIVKQTAFITRMSPIHAADDVARETRSLDVDSTTTHACVDLKGFKSHDVVKVVDMVVADDSETLFNSVVCENDPGQCTPVGHTELHHCVNTESTASTGMSDALTSDPQDSKPSLSQVVSSCEQNTACTSKETVVEVTGSQVTVDCSEMKSPSSKRPYSSTSSCFEQDTATGATKLQRCVPSTLAADAQAQTSCSLEENESSALTCGAHTHGKVIGFALSPGTSPKVCIHRLKTLQDAFKTATNLNESDADVNNEGYFTFKPVRDTSSPRKLAVSPFKRRYQEPDTDIFGSRDYMAAKNSDCSTPKDGSEFPKPFTVCSSAVEQPANGISEQTVRCPGGVIEMSLLEDWGLQLSPTDYNKDQLTEKTLCLLDTEQDYDLDTTEADKAVECDIPEPEIVVCSPSAPVKTFTFRFPGEPGTDEDVTGTSEARTTEEEMCLVEERFGGVVPKLVPCSDMDTETIVSPSEELVNACLYVESSWKDEFDISESQVVDCIEVEVEDVFFSSHLSQESAENGCKLPETFDSAIGQVKVLEGSGLIEQSSERPRNCEEECLGHLSERLDPHCVDETNEKPVIQSENTEAFQTLESEAEQFVSVNLNGGRDTNSNIETGEGVFTIKGTEGRPENEKDERFPSLEAQVKEKGTGDAKEERVSLTGFPGEKDAGDGVKKDEPLNCPTVLPCSSEEKEKEISHEKATANESETKHLSGSSQCSVDVERNLTLPGSVKEKVEREECPGEPPWVSEGKGSEIFHMEKTECPDTSPSEEKGKDIRSEKAAENQREAKNFSGNATDASANAMAKSLASSTVQNNDKSAECKSTNYTVKSQLPLTLSELSDETAKNSKPAEKYIKRMKDVLLTESCETKSAMPTSRSSVSSTVQNNNSSPGSKCYGKSKKLSAKTAMNTNPAKNTSKTEGPVKPAEVKSASFSGIVGSAVKFTETFKSTKPVIRGSLCASSRTPCSAGVLYKDPRGKSEPLRDIKDLPRDNRIENIKRKRTAEHEWWGKPPMLIPIPNQLMENGRKLQKPTPPPPLVSLDRGLTRGQETRDISRGTSRDLNIGDHHSYQPYTERDRFDYFSPQMDYNRQSKRVTAIHEQQTYPCWLSPLPTPFPVNNRETGIMQHVVPDERRWYPRRGISTHEPRTNQFQQVCPSFPEYGRPASAPSSCRGPPMLSTSPALVPGPWLPPSNDCYAPYPLVRPR